MRASQAWEATSLARRTRIGKAGYRAREALWAYAFIAPTFLGFLVFSLGPMLASLGLSLYEWDVVRPARFVGAGNYVAMLDDERLLTSFRNTATFVVMTVGLNLIVALALAVALQRRLPTLMRYFYRTTFFVPMVTSIASIAIVFGFMFHKELGIINYYLGYLGIEKVPWLTSSRYAMLALIFTTVWKSFGFDLILFIAGLQNIPRHLYEAAAIDGANGWQQFWRISVPLLSPTIFFAVVIGMIGTFQMFDQAYIMTRGGPGDATRTIVMIMYEDAFGALRFGYGSAVALVLFLVILVLTILQFRFGQRLVHYQ